MEHIQIGTDLLEREIMSIPPTSAKLWREESPNTGRLKEWPVIESPAAQLCSSLAPVFAVTAAYFLYQLYARRKAIQ